MHYYNVLSIIIINLNLNLFYTISSNSWYNNVIFDFLTI